ncbi:hypothetical protein GBA52_004124 [Prunus armeniaca]|nr:hypothetical protein GBA52_004124 [Prunus armeniaca]
MGEDTLKAKLDSLAVASAVCSALLLVIGQMIGAVPASSSGVAKLDSLVVASAVCSAPLLVIGQMIGAVPASSSVSARYCYCVEEV